MSEQITVEQYNYDEFVKPKFMPLMRFHESPPVGNKAQDFPLWNLDGSKTSLSTIWKSSLYTVVEFGSFT